MNRRSLFLVDVLVNAAGALVMVFLVFASRQYSSVAETPPAPPKAAVLSIEISASGAVPGKALSDTVITLCAPAEEAGSSICADTFYPRHLGSSVDVKAEAEKTRLALARLVRPNALAAARRDNTAVERHGRLTLVFPCPRSGSGWSVAVEYGTVLWNESLPTPHTLTIRPALRGADPAAQIAVESGCAAQPMTPDRTIRCAWAIEGETACGFDAGRGGTP